MLKFGELSFNLQYYDLLGRAKFEHDLKSQLGGVLSAKPSTHKSKLVFIISNSFIEFPHSSPNFEFSALTFNGRGQDNKLQDLEVFEALHQAIGDA